MKKIFKLLLVIFFAYFIFQSVFKIFGKGYLVSYSIDINDNKYATIKEKYTSNTKNEKTNYYFEIDIDNNKFFLQTYENFNFSSKIIKDIRYYKGEYVCIYPIFKGKKQLTDVLCNDNGIIKDYQNIKGNDSKLDDFVKTLQDEKVYNDNFIDNKDDSLKHNELTIYNENLVKEHYLAINNYKGIYTLNTHNKDYLYDINFIKKDIYKRNLTAIVSKYYISPNYDNEYDFDSFARINIKDNSVSYIKFNFSISYNSYIQGIIDNQIYLIDKSNRKQYLIDPIEKYVKEIGNENIGFKYYDNKWYDVNVYDVIDEEKQFKTNTVDEQNSNFIKIDKVGNKLSGYYYYYQKNGALYDVYKSNVQSKKQLKYIFSTTDIENINYIDDYVYYYINNELKVYSDKTGNKTIFINSEYEFNNSLKTFVSK